MKCSECRWWKKGEQYRTNGECRKASPVPMRVLITTDAYHSDRPDATWPSSDQDDWCGCFEAAPPIPLPVPSFVQAHVPEVKDGGQG